MVQEKNKKQNAAIGEKIMQIVKTAAQQNGSVSDHYSELNKEQTISDQNLSRNRRLIFNPGFKKDLKRKEVRVIPVFAAHFDICSKFILICS